MKNLYTNIESKLGKFSADKLELSGISSENRKIAFIRQFIDSYKRVLYVYLVRERDIHINRTNPHSSLYDPIKAAIKIKQENFNEAIWNVFLYTHFGKHNISKYNLIRSVYGKLGSVPYWSWDEIILNLDEFKHWINENYDDIKQSGKFCNHRKYQSLKNTNSGTFSTIASFIEIVESNPKVYFDNIDANIKKNSGEYFDYLYNRFNKVIGFGRLATFDFLTMVGKIGLINIEPASPYIDRGNEGPLNGAKLLFDAQHINSIDANNLIKELGEYFNEYPYIMQILEDCLCNWQKSPDQYISFRG